MLCFTRSRPYWQHLGLPEPALVWLPVLRRRCRQAGTYIDTGPTLPDALCQPEGFQIRTSAPLSERAEDSSSALPLLCKSVDVVAMPPATAALLGTANQSNDPSESATSAEALGATTTTVSGRRCWPRSLPCSRPHLYSSMEGESPGGWGMGARAGLAVGDRARPMSGPVVP